MGLSGSCVQSLRLARFCCLSSDCLILVASSFKTTEMPSSMLVSAVHKQEESVSQNLLVIGKCNTFTLPLALISYALPYVPLPTHA